MAVLARTEHANEKMHSLGANGPGTARVSEIAAHWRVSTVTARNILDHHKLPACGRGVSRYRWYDVWRLERAMYVHPSFYNDYKAPLVLPSELPQHDPAGRSPRTLRRYAAEGRLPTVLLAPGLRRFRESELAIAFEHI